MNLNYSIHAGLTYLKCGYLVHQVLHHPLFSVWHTCHSRTFKRLYLTQRLSIFILISITHTVSPLPSSKTVVCTSPYSPWVCPFLWKSGQTDLGSDSSWLYNDSDPSLFIKSCCPLRLHTPLPLLPDPLLYPCRISGLLCQTKQEDGHRGEFRRACECMGTEYQKYVLSQILITFIFTLQVQVKRN